MSSGSGRARTIVLSAAAKVNLALEVLGKRDDGYHEIATVMQTVDLSDRLTLEEAEDLEIRTTVPDIPSDGTNLAIRAAAALRRAAGVDRGVHVILDKRIPVAAGLGGGSADAAAVLVGLNRLWRVRWSVEQLGKVAVELGMDVPFFLRGGTALATGRGERLERLGSASFSLVLVNPGVPVSTAETYGRVTPDMYSDGRRVRRTAEALASRRPSRVAATLYNSLEAAVTPVHPEVRRIEAALRAAGALGTVMSGSGPTVVGLARSFDHARQVRARMVRGSWASWAVRTLRGPAIRLRMGLGR